MLKNNNEDSNPFNEAQSIKRYFKELKKIPLLSGDEQIRLAVAAQGGDQMSCDKLVRSNLRFVVKVAKDYQYSGVSFEDLISEGNIGLIEAIQRFDASRGFKFISYAVWWIRQSITKSIYDNGGNIRLPVNRINSINKILKIKEKLRGKLGREPQEDEILSAGVDITSHDLRSFNTEGNLEISVEGKVSEDSEVEYGDMLSSDGLEMMEENIQNDSLREHLREILSDLSEREYEIICLYFGMDGRDQKTLKEIGVDLKMTNERVRQIKEDVLRRLRIFDKSSNLIEFLEKC